MKTRSTLSSFITSWLEESKADIFSLNWSLDCVFIDVKSFSWSTSARTPSTPLFRKSIGLALFLCVPNIEFKIAALEAVADIAIKQQLGARGLRKILDNALLDLQYELPELASKGVKTVVVTDQVITRGADPIKIKG